MWVWLRSTIENLLCFQNKEEDFDVTSVYDLQEDIYRTQIIYRENREILGTYYGNNWDTMEYWHRKGVGIVWEIHFLSIDKNIGFDDEVP